MNLDLIQAEIEAALILNRPRTVQFPDQLLIIEPIDPLFNVSLPSQSLQPNKTVVVQTPTGMAEVTLVKIAA